jgi:hypothetical protein
MRFGSQATTFGGAAAICSARVMVGRKPAKHVALVGLSQQSFNLFGDVHSASFCPRLIRTCATQ